MNSLIRLLMITVSAVLLLAACKQKEEIQNIGVSGSHYCTLRSVVQELKGCKDSSFIIYDSAGRISSTLRYNYCGSGTPGQPLVSRQWFVYDAGNVFILDTSFMANKDTIVVDAVLRILEHHQESVGTGVTTIAHYQYSPQGLLQSSVLQYSDAPIPADTTTYSFANGDLQDAVNKKGALHYVYYENKPIPASSYITQNGLTYGSAFIFKNPHLLKEIQDQSTSATTSFTYGFDAYGNVATKIVTPNGSPEETTRYYYVCAVE